MWGKWSPCARLAGMRNGAVAIENRTEAPREIKKMELPYDPAILLLGIYPKKLKSGFERDSNTPMFIAALFTTAKL